MKPNTDMDFASRVEAFVAENRLLHPQDRVLVALSGGADSVGLLLVSRELGYTVESAHCNFHLRGTESQSDEEFVRRLCQRLDIPLHVCEFDTTAYAHSQGMSIEMAARELRYGWFDQLCQERGISNVATAHHADDNVETLLLNLVRGTGLQGLCGIPPRNGRVVRPLLCVGRNDIVRYLEQKGQDYVTDSTNLQTDFTRNKIRLEVLPLLRQLNPAADANLQRCIENLAEVQKVYRASVDALTAAALDGPSELDIATIMRAPSPLCVLHELLAPLGFGRAQVVDILRSIHHTGCCFHSSTHRIVVDRQQLLIDTKDEVAASADDDMPSVDALLHSEIVPYVPEFRFEHTAEKAYFDADLLAGRLLSLRHPRRGDRLRPFGMKGSRLVSDLLTDLKLSRLEKERQWLLCAGDDIVWVVGRRASDLYRVTSSTRRVIIFTTRDNGEVEG